MPDTTDPAALIVRRTALRIEYTANKATLDADARIALLEEINTLNDQLAGYERPARFTAPKLERNARRSTVSRNNGGAW